MKLLIVRVSRKRRPAPGFALKFAGKSVKGTIVSSCASAGSAEKGILIAARPAIAARLPFRSSRRSTFCDISLYLRNDRGFYHHHTGIATRSPKRLHFQPSPV